MESQKVEGTASAGQGKGKVFKAASFLGAAVIGGSLIGGGTLALWNDSVATDSYDIQAGTMAIEQIGGMTLTDISGGITNDDVLERETFLASPGKKIQVQQEFDIALDGTDLYAAVDTQELSEALVAASAPTDGGEPFALIDNVQFKGANGEVLISEGNEYHFASSDSPSKDSYDENAARLATQTAPGTTTDGTPEIVVTYDVEFTNVDDLEGAGETLASLNSVELTLQQRATWG